MGRILKLILIGSLIAPSACFANDFLDVYLAAKEQDQQYQAALHARDAAIEARPTALSALLPQLNATDQLAGERLHVLSTQQSGNNSVNSGNDGVLTNATTQTTDHYGTSAYTVNLSQTLFDWSAFVTLAQASRQVAEAEATLRSAQQSLISRAAQAYFALLDTRDALRVDVEARDGYNEQLVQAQSKYKAGLVAITDVRNAQASYDTSNALVITDKIALNAAQRALEVIVGKPVVQVANLRVNIPLEAPSPASADAWSGAAAHSNPDLLATQYAAEVAQKQVSINRSKYLPTLSASGSVGHNTSDSQFGDDVVTDSIGLNLNWNLFSGGLVSSQVRQARANFLQAESQLELQRRTVDQTTRNDYQQVVDGISAIEANRLAVISNQASVVATKVGLRVGTRTETDVLVASQALSTAQKAYYESRYRYLFGVLSLKQDAGNLGDSDVADIDQLFESTLTSALDPGTAQPIPGVSSEGALDPTLDSSTEIEAVPVTDALLASAMSPNELPAPPAPVPQAENRETLKSALSISAPAAASPSTATPPAPVAPAPPAPAPTAPTVPETPAVRVDQTPSEPSPVAPSPINPLSPPLAVAPAPETPVPAPTPAPTPGPSDLAQSPAASPEVSAQKLEFPAAENVNDSHQAVTVVPLAKPGVDSAARAASGPVINCPASNLYWKAGDNRCSGRTPAAADHATVTVRAYGKDGQVDVTCNDGHFSGIGNISCAVDASPAPATAPASVPFPSPNLPKAAEAISPASAPRSAPPLSCAATSLYWKVNGNRCSGTVPAAPEQSSVTVRAAGKAGQIDVTCDGGRFSGARNMSCAADEAKAPTPALAPAPIVPQPHPLPAPVAPPAARAATAGGAHASCPAFTLHGSFANGESLSNGKPCVANFPSEPEGVVEKLICYSPGLVPRVNFSACLPGGAQGPVNHSQ